MSGLMTSITSGKMNRKTNGKLKNTLITMAGVLITPFLAMQSHATAIFEVPELTSSFYYNYKEQNNVNPDVQTLTTDVFGDKIDLGSGIVSFTQTDVSLPGNFNIPVAITRTLSSPDSWHNAPLQFGNWSLDIPHVSSVYVTKGGDYKDAYWPNGLACSSKLNDNPSFSKYFEPVSYRLRGEDYWHGDTIYIPGKGSSKLLTKEGDLSYKRYTNRNWVVSCIEAEAGKPEGFKVVTEDGMRYYFTEQRVVQDVKKLSLIPVITELSCGTAINWRCGMDMMAPSEDTSLDAVKYNIFLLVSRIEDKFNNAVDYTYVNGQLIEISASDDRKITIGYKDNLIEKVTANNRVWQYTYDPAAFGVAPLNQVKLPNDQVWSFNNANNFTGGITFWRELYPPTPFEGEACIEGIKDDQFIEITHPDGLKGTFYVSGHCHGQSNVPRIE